MNKKGENYKNLSDISTDKKKEIKKKKKKRKIYDLNNVNFFDEVDATKSESSTIISTKESKSDKLKDEDVTSDNSDDTSSSSNKKKRKPSSENKMKIKEAINTVNEIALYTSINRFFRKKVSNEKIKKMIDIINEKDEISLRLLNWFAMKYSSKMDPFTKRLKNGNINIFDVKISYNAQLKSHSKKYFDPFRRGSRFDYNYDQKDKTKIIETTLCQLNFFMWLFDNNLLDYVETNFKKLRDNMGTYEKNNKQKKIQKKEKKIKNIIVKKDNKDDFEKNSRQSKMVIHM
jgi:hypothetical protein